MTWDLKLLISARMLSYMDRQLLLMEPTQRRMVLSWVQELTGIPTIIRCQTWHLPQKEPILIKGLIIKKKSTKIFNLVCLVTLNNLPTTRNLVLKLDLPQTLTGRLMEVVLALKTRDPILSILLVSANNSSVLKFLSKAIIKGLLLLVRKRSIWII